MNDLIVYRVQDKDGRGPWKPGFSHCWIEDRDDHDNLVPWPIEFGRVDLLASSSSHVGCACRSMDQLRRWFTESEYLTLRKLGYRAVKIRANKILGESKIQCVFERGRALKKGVVPFHLYPIKQ